MADALSACTLLVEGDQALAGILCDELRRHGHQAMAVDGARAAWERLKEVEVDVALVDLRLPDGSGLDLLRQIAEDDLPMEAIILADQAMVSAAIEAMKRGAYDYLTKPVRMNEMEALVCKAAEKARLRRENQALKVWLAHQAQAGPLITEDPALKEILASLERVAQADLPVLIQGELGTGKELVARTVHRLSSRSSSPFVAVSCAGVPPDLLENGLFGVERRVLPGSAVRQPGLIEAAAGGVVFLEQVAEIPQAVQLRLLRVLESRELLRVGASRPTAADVRLVSATARDLKLEVQQGRFLEDLYYRLNGVTVTLPPLRQRRDDIPLLAEHFARRLAPGRRISALALEALKSYSWPGNVRELQMLIERAAFSSSTGTLEAETLLPTPQRWSSLGGRSGPTLAAVERMHIEAVLRENQGHRGRTAKVLGIDPKTLYNKLGPGRPRKTH